MLLAYPFTIKPTDNGTFLAVAIDIPEAITQGDTVEEAFKHAEDALVTALSFYVEGREDLPQPSKKGKGQYLVPVPVLPAAKLFLYQAMREKRITQAKLGELIQVDGRQVRRMLDIRSKSRFDLLQSALEALGKHLTLAVQ